MAKRPSQTAQPATPWPIWPHPPNPNPIHPLTRPPIVPLVPSPAPPHARTHAQWSARPAPEPPLPRGRRPPAPSTATPGLLLAVPNLLHRILVLLPTGLRPPPRRRDAAPSSSSPSPDLAVIAPPRPGAAPTPLLVAYPTPSLVPSWTAVAARRTTLPEPLPPRLPRPRRRSRRLRPPPQRLHRATPNPLRPNAGEAVGLRLPSAPFSPPRGHHARPPRDHGHAPHQHCLRLRSPAAHCCVAAATASTAAACVLLLALSPRPPPPVPCAARTHARAPWPARAERRVALPMAVRGVAPARTCPQSPTAPGLAPTSWPRAHALASPASGASSAPALRLLTEVVAARVALGAPVCVPSHQTVALATTYGAVPFKKKE
nr:vegetative cell wall protein gp1-like [Aegilops tauschii subsp. strangulata]